MRDKHVKDEIFNLFFKTGFLINITVKFYQYKNSQFGRPINSTNHSKHSILKSICQSKSIFMRKRSN